MWSKGKISATAYYYYYVIVITGLRVWPVNDNGGVEARVVSSHVVAADREGFHFILSDTLTTRYTVGYLCESWNTTALTIFDNNEFETIANALQGKIYKDHEIWIKGTSSNKYGDLLWVHGARVSVDFIMNELEPRCSDREGTCQIMARKNENSVYNDLHLLKSECCQESNYFMCAYNGSPQTPTLTARYSRNQLHCQTVDFEPNLIFRWRRDGFIFVEILGQAGVPGNMGSCSTISVGTLSGQSHRYTCDVVSEYSVMSLPSNEITDDGFQTNPEQQTTTTTMTTTTTTRTSQDAILQQLDTNPSPVVHQDTNNGSHSQDIIYIESTAISQESIFGLESESQDVNGQNTNSSPRLQEFFSTINSSPENQSIDTYDGAPAASASVALSLATDPLPSDLAPPIRATTVTSSSQPLRTRPAASTVSSLAPHEMTRLDSIGSVEVIGSSREIPTFGDNTAKSTLAEFHVDPMPDVVVGVELQSAQTDYSVLISSGTDTIIGGDCIQSGSSITITAVIIRDEQITLTCGDSAIVDDSNTRFDWYKDGLRFDSALNRPSKTIMYPDLYSNGGALEGNNYQCATPFSAQKSNVVNILLNRDGSIHVSIQPPAHICSSSSSSSHTLPLSLSMSVDSSPSLAQTTRRVYPSRTTISASSKGASLLSDELSSANPAVTIQSTTAIATNQPTLQPNWYVEAPVLTATRTMVRMGDAVSFSCRSPREDVKSYVLKHVLMRGLSLERIIRIVDRQASGLFAIPKVDETYRGHYICQATIVEGQQSYCSNAIKLTVLSDGSICPCSCRRRTANSSAIPIGAAGLQEATSKIREGLALPPDNLSATKRKKTSATDGRQSSTGIGFVAMATLFGALVLLALSDCVYYILPMCVWPGGGGNGSHS